MSEGISAVDQKLRTSGLVPEGVVGDHGTIEVERLTSNVPSVASGCVRLPYGVVFSYPEHVLAASYWSTVRSSAGEQHPNSMMCRLIDNSDHVCGAKPP